MIKFDVNDFLTCDLILGGGWKTSLCSTVLGIANNWKEPARKACGHSTNILTPATNAAHHDHLHLDKGMGLPCWVRKLKESVSIAF